MTATKKNYIRQSYLYRAASRSGLIILYVVMAFFAVPAHAADEEDSSKLPVPRFVSLRSNEVNMRVGPGTRYRISWVYHREGLPVEVIQEFDQWREIRDSEGTTGWVHKQMLQGKRSAVVVGKIAVMRHAPDAASRPSLRAEPGVIGRLLSCEKSWCRIQVSGRKGWIQKSSIFGAYKKEEF